ncbi:MAG TPA: tyrosine--tRNA ligase [Actinomycetales bacterium]|nr:tyrosine--tRNA ligase [Actinomycetales bacterium]
MTDILDELHWRGLVAQATDEAALREALAAGPVTYYCGFDPTAPSLHMGNLVQLITMRRLQNAGHRPIALVGGSTGLIGDPKPTAERTLNSPETVASWVETLREQVSRFLRPDGPNPVEVVNNLDWTAPLSALDFLRDIGKHFRVNRMLAKEAVSARLDSQDGISYTEFSYQILQGMDFLELYRKYGCVLQLGGSDQWGNLTAGVDLIHRVEQVSVHALTTTLITKSDGTKYGKTEGGGTVWLDAEMMSPYAFYQFWLNAEDSQVGRLLRVFTFRSREEIEALEQATRERPQAREGQRVLAADVTTLVHGERATEQAIAASQALFGRGALTELDEQTLRDATAELARATVGVGTPVVEAFVAAGLAPSRSGARRTISEGGAYINNTKVDDVDAVLAADQLLHGRYVVLRRGRKALAAGVADGA